MNAIKDDSEVIMRDVANQLRLLLSNSGMSQRELAEKLKVTTPYISHLLKGRFNLTIKQMVRIAKVFSYKIRIDIL